MAYVSSELDNIIRQSIPDDSTYHRIRRMIESERAPVEEQTHYLKQLHRLVTTNYDSLEDMFEAYLEVGCSVLGLSSGVVSFIDAGIYHIEASYPDRTLTKRQFPLSDVICRVAIEKQSTQHFHNMSQMPSSPKPTNVEYADTENYIGTPLRLQGNIWGTICFFSTEKRDKPFADHDVEFVELMAQGISSALDHTSILELQALAEDRYRLMFENIDTPVILYEVDTYEIIDVNRAAMEFYGYTYDEFLQITAFDLNMLPHEDIDNRIMESRAAGQAYTRFPHRLKTGDIREVEAYISDLEMDNRLVRFAVIYDYSERHQAEEALKHSEANLRAIFDTTTNYMFLVDDTASIVALNRSARRLIAQINNVEPENINTIHGVSISADRYLVNQYLKLALQGKSISHETYVDLPNQEPMYIDYRYVPVKTADGNIIGVCVTGQDITTLKTSQEDLARERNVLRALIDNLPDSIYIKDANARILMANQEYVESTIIATIEDVIGKNAIDLFPEMGQQFYQDDVEVLNGKRIIGKHEPIVSEGEVVGTLETTKIPLYNEHGHVVGLVGVGRDITQQLAMEQGLRDNEEKFTQLITHIPEAFWIYDVQANQIIYASDSYETTFGVSLADRQRNVNLFLAQVHPEDRKLVIESLTRQSQGKSAEYEARFLKEEQYRWVSIRIYPILNDTDVPYRMAGIASDITERKQAEQDKLEMMAQRERITILSQFVRDATHEFKTPLSVINTRLYVMEKSDDPDVRATNLQLIRDQVEGISGLIESLVLMSRLDSRASLTFNAVDINAIMRQVSASILSDYSERANDITVTLDDELPPVLGQLTYISTAVKNLVDNAVRYSEVGQPITIRTYHKESRVIIEVKDKGIGITKAESSEIFKRFYRRDVAHSTRGFGLGLPIAQRIAQRHGGQVTFESVEGAGSTFYIHLPKISVLSD